MPEDKIRQQLLESQTHEQILNQVIDFLHLKGFHIFGVRPGMTKKIYRNKKGEEYPVYKTAVIADGKGFPDIFAVRGVRDNKANWSLLLMKLGLPPNTSHIVVEIKTEKDEQSPEQLQWQDWFEEAGIAYIVVKPSTWDDFVKILE